MTNLCANRAKKIKSSATVAINAKAQQLKSEGIDIINFSVGEPDFDTPDPIKKAAISAIQSGFTKYTATDGIPALKQAIVDKFKHENQLDYALNQILVSNGAKQSFYNLMQAVLNPDDEVIIPAPYWVSYPSMVELAEGRSVVVKTTLASKFKLTADQLEKAITDKTKLLVLNTPSNPTGMAYTEGELKSLGNVLKKYPNILIATDDMYEHILWSTKQFINIVNVCPELKDRTIVINGVSKAYAMTGWRIGYAAGPVEIIQAMTAIQSHSTSNSCTISQYAALEALTGDQTCVHEMNKIFKQRHDVVLKGLNEVPSFHCEAADGAFYLFPDVSQAIQACGLKDDVEYTAKILNEAHVAVVPGTEFGMPGFIRVSFANSMDNLQEGLRRLKALSIDDHK